MHSRWGLRFTRRDAHQRRKDFAYARRMLRIARMRVAINEQAESMALELANLVFAPTPFFKMIREEYAKQHGSNRLANPAGIYLKVPINYSDLV